MPRRARFSATLPPYSISCHHEARRPGRSVDQPPPSRRDVVIFRFPQAPFGYEKGASRRARGGHSARPNTGMAGKGHSGVGWLSCQVSIRYLGLEGGRLSAWISKPIFMVPRGSPARRKQAKLVHIQRLVSFRLKPGPKQPVLYFFIPNPNHPQRQGHDGAGHLGEHHPTIFFCHLPPFLPPPTPATVVPTRRWPRPSPARNPGSAPGAAWPRWPPGTRPG